MTVRIERTAIAGLLMVTTVRHQDERGSFSETYSRRAFAAGGIACDFVQDNHSHSVLTGTVRGLHFQVAPAAQDKLIRVLRGAILDVAVDLRRSSPSFGRHVALPLSAGDCRQLYIPVGFAHGFCTIEPDTEVIYKASGFYTPEAERGLAWDDPALGIAWPVGSSEATLSERDRRHPRLAELPDTFA